MKLDYKHIGARMQERRKNIGISQARLAETVDLSAKYISQIEQGVRHLILIPIRKCTKIRAKTCIYGFCEEFLCTLSMRN